MSQSSDEIEREIAATRARLDRTIDAIQDRLTLSGIADEVIGTMRSPQIASGFDQAIATVRRNPLPVMVAAAGVGWLVHWWSRRPRNRIIDIEPEVPLLNTGQARIYDPDAPPRHPAVDSFESRRDAAA
jgi:hypothetical protein